MIKFLAVFFLMIHPMFPGKPLPKTIYLGPQQLQRSPMGQHIKGDEELSKYQDTDLSGSFTLSVKNGSLTGTLDATILEDGGDRTTFRIYYEYIIYTPPSEYVIDKFTILYSVHPTSSFHFRQRAFRPQRDVCLTGPLNSFDWSGDTNSDQDQINSCYIIPYLKRVLVSLVPVKK